MQLAEIFFNRWLVIMYRALIVLGPMFLIFWVLKPRWLQRFRIHQPRQVKPQTMEELPRAILGLSMYLVPGLVLFWLNKQFNYSPIYLDIAQYGWPYFFLSMLIFALGIDTWFYWLHYFMHRNKFLMRVHAVHHRSYNVTPASGYSFDLIESFLTMLPYLILTVVIPWHPLALTIFGFFGIFYNGYIHLGYDFAFDWRQKIPGLNWFNSSTHHSLHHQRSSCNYAVYFTHWDRWMSTEVTGSAVGSTSPEAERDLRSMP